MRLWHVDLIPYLPRTQLLAQWRELNSIFKKQDKHILINYIYTDYDALENYSFDIITEFKKRNYKMKDYNNFENFFNNTEHKTTKLGYDKNFKEHNKEYLLICFMNLYEKYLRGQKDFDTETFNRLYDFVNTKIDLTQLEITKGEK